MKGRRVVITGLGALTPLANDVPNSWKAILEGKSGIRPITSFDVTDFSSKISGSVQNFDPTQYMPAKEVRRTDVFIQYAMAAAAQAVEDAGLDNISDLGERSGVAVGSGIGGLSFLEKSHSVLLEVGPRKLSPFFIPAIAGNMASGYISIKYGIKGPSMSLVSACATGVHNIGESARLIAYGDVDIMLCGGSEMATVGLGVGGFCAMHALSTRNDEPEKASRPWDKDRDGFVLGDGAGIMVLEEFEHAKKRGAKIYAELSGFGMSSDAHHITAPDSFGAARCMRNAIKDAGINITDIDYINAHATSTLVGDISEVNAIKTLFQDYAYKLAISSTKSMTGHLLGATGAVEAIFTALAVYEQVAPPTANLDNPDVGCDLNFVPKKAQKMKIENALCNSFGFGGTNACLVLKKIS